MNKKMEFRIDNDLKEDFIRICQLQDKVPSKVIRGMIESYIADNNSGMIMVSKDKFMGECEDILSQKIEVALEKDPLVYYLTFGTKLQDIRLIDLMIDDLQTYKIGYDLDIGKYVLSDNLNPPTLLNNAEEYVEWFLREEVGI